VSKIFSISSWTTSIYFSTVTDLVLIYESVTSSVFVVHRLTPHSWTLSLNCSLTDSRMNWLTTQVWMTQSTTCPPFITLDERMREHHLQQFMYLSIYRHGNVCQFCIIQGVVSDTCLANCVSEPLLSNGLLDVAILASLFRLSPFMSQYIGHFTEIKYVHTDERNVNTHFERTFRIGTLFV
jgi:hypothetical protein